MSKPYFPGVYCWVCILLADFFTVFCSAFQPLAYWPLTNSSGQMACDLSSNALHGICSGTEWTGGGEALEFLPPESMVQVRTKTAAPLDCPQSFTFTAWIRPASLSGYRMLICNGRQDSAASGYNFYLNGQALGLILYTERMDRYKAEVKAPLAAGLWTHVAVSYEAEGKTVFYVDGRKIGEVPAAGRVRYRPNQSHPSVYFTLGSVAAYSDWFYEGLIREVKVFGCALAVEEVAAEHAASIAIASLNPETQEQRFARILTGEVRGRILDETGQPVTAMVTLSDAAGKKYGPVRLFYSCGSFFATQGVYSVKVPAGKLHLTVTHGPEYLPYEGEIDVNKGLPVESEIRLTRFTDLRARGWYAGEHHFHYRTHGQQRSSSPTWGEAVDVARAGDLSFMSYKETIKYPAVVEPRFLCREDMFEGRSHHNIGGHVEWVYITEQPNPATFSYLEAKRLGALGIPDTSEQKTAAVLDDPSQTLVRDVVVGAILGDTPIWDIFKASSTGTDPSTVWLMDAWYHFLNCGIRLAAGGFTDSDLNLASCGQAPGYGRTYAKLDRLTWENVISAYRNGRVFATTGPILLFTVNGQGPGALISLSTPGNVSVGIEALSQQGFEKIEIIRNGRVIETVTGEGTVLKKTIGISIEDTSWLAARCFAKNGKYFGSFAHASPVYIEVARHPMHPREEDIQFMLSWIAGYRKLLSDPGKLTAWHGSPAMFPEILEHLDKAEAAYRMLRESPKRFTNVK